MATERIANCPQCGQLVRLTEPELIQKRGFCAVCDARFDILPELFVGEGPTRSLVVPRVAEPLAPPTRHIRELPARGGSVAFQISAVGRRAEAVGLGVFSVAWWSFLIFWYSMAFAGNAPWIMKVFPIGHVAVGVFLVWKVIWAVGGREEITVDHSELVRRRGACGLTRTRRVPIDQVSSVAYCEPRLADGWNAWGGGMGSMRGRARMRGPMVKLLLRGDESVSIGQDLGHSEEAMQWLARRLERAVREARLTERAR